ncbi:MAG: penicillin-binding transpeptidase domain-containing protein [Minisyncoccota bacterium]
MKLFFLRKKKNNRGREIYPDEIFLDAKNLPEFNVHQMEGRIEQPIAKRVIQVLGAALTLMLVLFASRAFSLQVKSGQMYHAKAEANRLEQIPIFARRGIINDRNGVPLVWNTAVDTPSPEFRGVASTTDPLIAVRGSSPAANSSDPYIRSYIRAGGFAHVLGYVSYPLRDAKGTYYQPAFLGKAGVEATQDRALQGANGTQVIETDAVGRVSSESIINPPRDGQNVSLSIDAGVQAELYSQIESLAHDKGFTGGAGVIMDVHTGEMLALVSYPEYDPQVLSLGDDRKKIQEYLTGSSLPLLDRALSGLYTPGSIVKPFMAVGALEERIISPDKKILSTGSISIPNPYDPKLTSIFRDWQPQGWVDMRKAIAMSSDVYFYEIGGGYLDQQQGLGIGNIKKYATLFGIGSPTGIPLWGETTGVIPDPEWKAKNFNGEPWRLGDTYHTVIGQYGFQVTPLQMVRAAAALANGGTLLRPQIIHGVVPQGTTLPLRSENLAIARDGMHQAVEYGTAKGLFMSEFSVAGKTGTAELGSRKKYVNSWVMGFFPFEDPQYAFVVVMERGPYENTIGGVYVMRQVFEWLAVHRPQYVGIAAPPEGVLTVPQATSTVP